MKCYKFISLLVVFFAITTLTHAQSTGPCTGSEYTTNTEYFRAYASALSSDATASKKKAMTSARTALENQIKTKAEAAAKSQTKISGADIAQLNSLIQGAIQQEVVKMKVICENSEQTGGRYKTHIVVEVTKANVLTNIVNSAKNGEQRRVVFSENSLVFLKASRTFFKRTRECVKTSLLSKSPSLQLPVARVIFSLGAFRHTLFKYIEILISNLRTIIYKPMCSS